LPEFDIKTDGVLVRDKRSDISLCCAVLVYMLTGRTNLPMFSPSKAGNLLDGVLNPKLQFIIAKGLQEIISDRFDSIQSIIDLLETEMDWELELKNLLERAPISEMLTGTKDIFLQLLEVMHPRTNKVVRFNYNLAFTTHHANDPQKIEWRFTFMDDGYLSVLADPNFVVLLNTAEEDSKLVKKIEKNMKKFFGLK